ncbi:MAG TPA: DUF4157 domain-containing protein [Longimicrobium sp.]
MHARPPGTLLQRCACGGTCPRCRDAQRKQQQQQQQQQQQEQEQEQQILQARPIPAQPAGEAQAPPVVHEVLRSAGQPLDPATRAFMEPRFGRDFSGVRIHTGARAADSAAATRAQAYTVGHSIVFGEGRFDPASASGRRLLAHELTHVVQQTERGSPDPAVQRLPQPAGAAPAGGNPESDIDAMIAALEAAGGTQDAPAAGGRIPLLLMRLRQVREAGSPREKAALAGIWRRANRPRGAATPLQRTPLHIGSPHDPAEREADRVAERVVSHPAGPVPPASRQPIVERPGETTVLRQSQADSAGELTLLILLLFAWLGLRTLQTLPRPRPVPLSQNPPTATPQGTTTAEPEEQARPDQGPTQTTDIIPPLPRQGPCCCCAQSVRLVNGIPSLETWAEPPVPGGPGQPPVPHVRFGHRFRTEFAMQYSAGTGEIRDCSLQWLEKDSQVGGGFEDQLPGRPNDFTEWRRHEPRCPMGGRLAVGDADKPSLPVGPNHAREMRTLEFDVRLQSGQGCEARCEAMQARMQAVQRLQMNERGRGDHDPAVSYFRLRP